MTDEPVTDEPVEPAAETPEPVEGTATATAEADGEKKPVRLNQEVDVIEVGPCKKHIKVTINRDDIDARLEEKYSELVTERSYIAGFRPGKAPRKIVERRYQKEVYQQLRGELLMASLEQLAEEQDIAPLSPPNLDPGRIVLPEKGPMVYEFEVEVRPQFQLPEYKGLKLKRPVQEFTDEDITREQRRLLEPYGQIIPKAGDPPTVEIGDYVFADITTKLGERTLNTLKEVRIRVDPQLALRDGMAKGFGKVMTGATAGESRVVDIALSDAVADPDLRGKAIQATFEVKDIKSTRLPEVTPELLREFGVRTPEQFDELIRVVLQRRLEYLQRQSARSQVISQVADAAMKELPQDLLLRQARRAFARKVMEMRSAGMPETEIKGRQRLLEQDIIKSTTLALKEHFVLQKIAEDEKLDVTDDDIDDEIERIAARNDESPRKVRARLERDDLVESLAAELLESKALDLILEKAEFEDVPLKTAEEDEPVAMVEEQVVPGEMQSPISDAEAEAEAEAEAAETEKESK